jgi:CheY-like chemotaxis protein
VTVVLVVEDEFLVRMAITLDLIAKGYDVLTASNADQAIKILESRNDIETIFTDIEMPGSMDGLKLAQARSLSVAAREHRYYLRENPTPRR